MSFQTLQITTAGVTYDVSKYLYSPIQKTSRASDPDLLDFSLLNYDGNMPPVGAGSYVKVTTNTYGVWYTGYIITDPSPVRVGTNKKVTKFELKLQATSDEYLLNKHPLGIQPPFINAYQGTILKALVAALTPAGVTFDTSNIQQGIFVPRYVVDPNQHFSDVVGAFAKAANFRFYALNHFLSYAAIDTVNTTVSVDGTDKHFTPSRLQITPNTDSIINQATVLGNLEPQNTMHEFFVGDGVTGKFPLISSVYGADSSTLLDDSFTGSTIDTSKWTVYDPTGTVLTPFGGTINVIGGSNNSTYDTSLQSANLIPLEGTLRITHGEYDFVGNSTGVIGGLFAGNVTPNLANLVYGIKAEVWNFNGGNWVQVHGTTPGATPAGPIFQQLKPFANGVADNSQFANLDYSKRYIIRTIYNFDNVIRQSGDYSYVNSQGQVVRMAGGSAGGYCVAYTWITEIDPTTAAITNQWQWINQFPLTANQTFGYYCPVVVDLMNLTFTGVTVSSPIQASLQHKAKGTTSWGPVIIGPNELDAYDGLAPAATIVDSNQGATTKSSLLGTRNYNPGQASLQYFSDAPVALPSNTLAAINPNLSAVPNPIRIPVGTTSGSTTISWANGPSSSMQLQTDGGIVVASGGTSGSYKATNVSNGTNFYLYDVSHTPAVLVTSMTVETQTMYIPQAGDMLWIKYQSAGASMGVAQDPISITAQSAAWGDDGIRSETIMNLSPLPRTSYECEIAASAIVQGHNYQHFQGQYTVPNVPEYRLPGEPVAGTVMQFKNLPSEFPSYLKAEAVTQVVSTLDHVGNGNSAEHFTHQISFGPVNTQSAALATLRNTANVFTPQDSAEIPAAVKISSLGLTTLPKPTQVSLTGWDTNYYYFSIGESLLTNGDFESGVSTGWLINGTGSVTSATKHSGTYSMSVGGNQSVVYQDIHNIVSGRVYVFSAWLSGPTQANLGHLAVHDTNGNNLVTQTFSTTSGVWSKVFVQYIANASGSLRVHVYSDSSSTIVFDDALLTSETAITNIFLQGYQAEVRYTDQGWGADAGKNLVARTATGQFKIPRNTRGKVCYVRTFDTRNTLTYSEDFTQSVWTKTNVASVSTLKGKNPQGDYAVYQRVTASSSAVASLTQSTTSIPQAGQTWVFAVDVKSDIATPVTLHFYTSDQTDGSSQVTFTTTATWKRYTVTQAFTRSNNTTGLVYNVSIPANGHIDITQAQAELITTGAETVYCKTLGSAYGATSRFSTGIHVGLPMIPVAPTATIDLTDDVHPKINVTLPQILQDVWGVEIRGSDNATVLTHVDLKDSTYTPSFQMPSVNTRTLSYYVYTYNILGEYSASYNVTHTTAAPAITGLSIDESAQTLSILTNSSVRTLTMRVQQPPNADANTNIIATIAVTPTGTSTQYQLPDNWFLPGTWFRVTPSDGIGAGVEAVAGHQYTPNNVVDFSAAEVFVVLSPTNATTPPTVPSALNQWSADYQSESRNNYANNQLIRS